MKAIIATVAVLSLAFNVILASRLWSAPPAVPVTTGGLVVMRAPGGLLEVSQINTVERFDSTTSHSVLGVPVGKTIAQVRVPAVYRFHIPLSKDWSFRVVGSTLVAVAPQVRPTLPVAIDTGKLESFSSGVWSPITGAESIAALQKSITARLGDKAATEELKLLQRETARQTVTEFVQKWVVDQPRWKGVRAPAVLVFFEDEPLGRQAMPMLTDGA